MTFEADTLIIGSGGTLAYGLLGALAHLDACNHLATVTRFVGVSVGSILAFLMCAGVDLKTVVKTFFDSHFSQFQSLSPVTLVASYGLDTGARLVNKIATVLTECTGISRNVTFAQLKAITQRDLAVGVCDILARRFVLMSGESHPDVLVLDAVRASFAIPFIYTPCIIQDRTFVDGAVISSYPIGKVLHQWPESKLIGIRVSQQGTHKQKIDGILDFVQTIFSCVGTESDWESTLHSSDRFKDISVKLDVDSMLSSPTYAQKMKMFETGYEASHLVFPPAEEPLD